MKNSNKYEKTCRKCKKNHKKNNLVRFYGVYGSYCIPIAKYRLLKSKLKISSNYKKHFNINEIATDDLYDEGTWKRKHFISDLNANEMYCRHRISGGCLKCFPDSYCGSIDDEEDEDDE